MIPCFVAGVWAFPSVLGWRCMSDSFFCRTIVCRRKRPKVRCIALPSTFSTEKAIGGD